MMPHGRHIYATADDMVMATMSVYPPSKHAMIHYKCVLGCCSNCPCIDLPDQESDRHYSNVFPSINFHVYHLIAQCAVHRRCSLY